MRLLSWNIHKGIGGRDRLYRLERIIEVIEAENPDLICLQEVDRLVHRSSNDDQPRLLSSYFRCDAVYQPTVHVRAGCYGNLILSRWPLRSRHRVSLRLNSRKPRGAAVSGRRFTRRSIFTGPNTFGPITTGAKLADRAIAWACTLSVG